jgi:hypothetical protein
VPRWDIFVDDARVAALPVTARYGQVVVVHDGVTYLAIRPLPTDDRGRGVDVTLEAGVAQASASYRDCSIRPALLVNAYLYKKDTDLDGGTLAELDGAQTGFVVEMGDEMEYGSFEKFQAHIRETRLSVDKDGATYQTGPDTVVASWEAFTVNGKDPYAYAKAQGLWQDTTLSQMGQARLEKNGAVIEREKSGVSMILQTFPKQKIYVAMNLLPHYQQYRFREPGGVQIVADGACSMGRWAVKESREIDIKYQAFGGEYAPKDPAKAATVLLITGTKGKPQVSLNGKEAPLKPWKDGWLVSLTGAMPKQEDLAARLGALEVSDRGNP